MRLMVFHLPRSWLSLDGDGIAPFYLRLFEGLKARDVPFDVDALDRATLLDRVAQDDALHVVNHGRFVHPRVRNADVAYIYPFWNFDPQGIRAFSSIAQKRFPRDDIDPDVARPFFRRLRKRLIGRRTSRYPQPEALEPGERVAAAVFLQSEGHRNVNEACYLDRWQMLDGVCAALDGPIVVKPHPRDSDPATQAGLQGRLARFPHLRISHGNIHDLIASADRVVTINSAVGIEAYLHRTPVVLCGQSDFHHIADVAQSADDLARILARGPRKRVYDKFIWWYFADQCLSSMDPDLADRAIARFNP